MLLLHFHFSNLHNHRFTVVSADPGLTAIYLCMPASRPGFLLRRRYTTANSLLQTTGPPASSGPCPSLQQPSAPSGHGLTALPAFQLSWMDARTNDDR